MMPISPWLWLNEAALLIAERLAAEEPDKFANAGAASTDARERLLDQAHRGALEIQGRSFQISEEREVPPLPEWISIDASFWSPEYRVKPRSPDWVCMIEMDWPDNCFWYERQDIDNRGYRDLRVQRADVDRLWPPADRERVPLASSAIAPAKNPGGAPRKWRDDLFIAIIRIANKPDGLPEDKSELFRQLRELSLPHWGSDGAPSDSTIREVLNRVYREVVSET